MLSNRRVVKTLLAIAVPLGMVGTLVFTSGAASAKKGPASTISCNSLTSTITFTPALVPGPSTSKKEQSSISNGTLSGCTENPADPNGPTLATSITAKVSKGKGNSCTTGITSVNTKFAFTIVWNKSGGTSKASFKGATLNTSPPGFTLSNGKVKGAFPTKTATITANLDGPSAAAAVACLSGSGPPLATLTVSGGSTTS